MRDSNYRSIANNRAAVTITTSLYDRRALDVTSDKPLVNSLNHLTYLVSSSAKVRETLSNDGGIERLVEILHECHNSNFSVNDNIFNSEKKLLTAWKWTLAFQCLVLIGTRGTEKIRQKVVRAGMLPIIATVLDNYMSLHEGNFVLNPLCSFMQCEQPAYYGNYTDDSQTGTFMNIRFPESARAGAHPDAVYANDAAADAPATAVPVANINSNMAITNNIPANINFSSIPSIDANVTSIPAMAECKPFFSAQINSLTSEDYDNLTVEQLFKLIRGNYALTEPGRSSVNNDIRRRYLIVAIIKKLREEKAAELPDGTDGACDYDMDNNLQFLSDLYLQDEKFAHVSNVIHAKIAPRNFTETGVVIPRDDDVVWCLQLLAYISKYPYLKDVLQNTHLIVDMSIRDKKMRMFSGKKMRGVSSRDTLIPRLRKGRIFSPSAITDNYVERFNASPSNSPQMPSDLNLRSDNFDIEEKLDLYKPDDFEDAEANDFDDDDDYDDESDHRKDDDYMPFEESEQPSYLHKLYDKILDAEATVNDLNRMVALCRISDKVNVCIEAECERLSNTIIEKRLEQKQYLAHKWNYDTYANFDIDDDVMTEDNDYDESLVEYKKVNLFPVVEKFTFLAGTDMYYWLGVIMRNSCRRNDFKGGVRQCGNLECGKWEKYPREFSKCKRCKRTKYCSRDCQMRAWQCHKNWCVPSGSSSGSTATTHSTSTHFDGQHDRTINVTTVVPSDSDGIISNNGELSQQVSASDQETQLSEL